MVDEHQKGALLLGGEVNQVAPMIIEEIPDVNMDAAGVAEESKELMPGPEQQAATIKQLESRQPIPGEQLYIIDHNWWSDWCNYTNFDNNQQRTTHSSGSDSESSLPPPMEIDNSSIVDNNTGDLMPDLEENQHFVIVTPESWGRFHSWYGGGPVISRPALPDGLAPTSKKARVHVYDWKIDVVWSGEPNDFKTLEAAPTETARSFKERACKAFNLDPDKINLYDFFNGGKYVSLEPQLDSTLDSCRILEGQQILLDDKDKPLQQEEKQTSSSPIIVSNRSMGRTNSLSLEDNTIQRSGNAPGRVGLQNLGNTCFMNSSLQCLMHSVPIMSVFLTGAYEADLNTSNPLGMKGQLATAFGALMGNVWRPEVGLVVPKGFKSKIAQFAPQFSGYAQHDSQEFLAFLLDGLHEDINRIQIKPYIEEPDSDGVPDKELAARAWANYRARNDSHIVDHFQGLYKSTLVCPQCSYSSIKFDPFMYLSLPLPESKVRQLTVILLHVDGTAPAREYGLEVPQSGTVRELYVALARVAKLDVASPEQQMVAATLNIGSWSYNITVHEDPKARLSEVLGRDHKNDMLLVYFYSQPELGPAAEGNKQVLVFHNKATGGRRTGTSSFFSAPILLYLPPEETYDPQLHILSTTTNTAAAAGGSNSFNFSSSGSSDPEYIVMEDAPIWSHVRRVLRPFLAVPQLRQRPAAENSVQEAGEAMQQDGQQQQQAAGLPDDVSLAAAAAAAPPGSPAASPDACCASKPLHDAAAAAAADDNNNSTWGSHGSASPRSDIGSLEAMDADDADLAAAADDSGEGAADPAATGASSPIMQVSDADDGEMDVNAAFAMQELNTGLESSSNSGAAAAEAAADDGVAGHSLGWLQGVPAAPLDMWAAQSTSQQQAAGASSPAVTPPGSTTTAAAAGEAPSVAVAEADSSSRCWPHYTLKLARDDHSFPTAVSSWNAQYFHPNIHHHTFVIDWDVNHGYTVPFVQYIEAATAEQQQQEQQDAGSNSSSLGDSYWLPNPDSVDQHGAPLSQQKHDDIVIVGDYCLSALQQREYDPSTAPIRTSRFQHKTVALEACVEAFLQPEQLSEADEWYCPKCKQHVQADKKLDLWSLPEVLVVHLKRFSYTRWNRDKLDTEVVFPLQQLDLSRYVLHEQEQAPIYDCYAVSNHYGGLGGGHYTAFAQMPNDKKWYCFDDSRVEDMPPDQVQTKAAYVLFYRRRQQVQADPPNLVDDLVFQRQQHLEQRRLSRQQQREQEEATGISAAAAAATAAIGGLQALPAAAVPAPATPLRADTDMEMDVPTAVHGPIGAAATAAAPSSPAAAADTWGSPSPQVRGSAAPPAAATALGSGRVGTSIAAARGAESTSDSTGLIAGAEDDGESSDCSSSSRPRRQRRQLRSSDGNWAPSAAADAAALGTSLAGLAAPAAAAQRRTSDQNADAIQADMDA